MYSFLTIGSPGSDVPGDEGRPAWSADQPSADPPGSSDPGDSAAVTISTPGSNDPGGLVFASVYLGLPFVVCPFRSVRVVEEILTEESVPWPCAGSRALEPGKKVTNNPMAAAENRCKVCNFNTKYEPGGTALSVADA